MAMNVTCDDCGYSGTLEYVKLHDCQIVEQGGRCEDAPLCMHGREGCMPAPSGTAEYWSNLRDTMGSEAYDYQDEMGWPDDMG